MTEPGINKKTREAETDLVTKLLKFVNVDRLESQDQVYEMFLQPPNTYTAMPFQRIAEAQGVKPFLNDRAIISRMLRDRIADNHTGIAKLHETLKEKLGMTLRVRLALEVEKGRIELSWQPALQGVEAHLYYGLSLIFSRGLDGLLRTCRARLEDGAPCDRIFLYTPKLRQFCSTQHQILGDRQRLTDWHDHRRKELGLPEFKWGSRSRKKPTATRRRKKMDGAKKKPTRRPR